MIRQVLRKLTEAMQRPGLLGITGIRRAKRCERDLAAYFRYVASKLPLEDLGKLAEGENKEAALHAAEAMLSRTLRFCQPVLVSALSVNLLLAFKEGYETAQVHEVAGLKEADDDGSGDISVGTPSGSPIDKLGATGQRAADFAATTAGDLIKGINQTTLDSLRDVIAEGFEEKLGVDGTARRIRKEVMDMSVKRAKVIATTEMNKAMSTATLEKLGDIGIEYKRWIPVSDPCPVCEGNADDGAIPVDEEFSSGDDSPPAHPNCRCAVVGARAPKEKE